jgi:hypothetical protein
MTGKKRVARVEEDKVRLEDRLMIMPNNNQRLQLIIVISVSLDHLTLRSRLSAGQTSPIVVMVVYIE